MACAIDLGSSVLITGGFADNDAVKSVREYNEAGLVLNHPHPSLNQERYYHGCSYYGNAEGNKVNRGGIVV